MATSSTVWLKDVIFSRIFWIIFVVWNLCLFHASFLSIPTKRVSLSMSHYLSTYEKHIFSLERTQRAFYELPWAASKAHHFKSFLHENLSWNNIVDTFPLWKQQLEKVQTMKSVEELNRCASQCWVIFYCIRVFLPLLHESNAWSTYSSQPDVE